MHNFTVHSLVGDAEKDPDSFGFTLEDGKAYGFRLVPEITKVSNNKGSINGQIITLDGYGFSKFSNEIKVKVGGVDCLIQSASLTSITCEVKETPDATAPATSPYVGGNYYCRENIQFL